MIHRAVLLATMFIFVISDIGTSCPKIRYRLHNFDKNRFLGTWYEIAKPMSFGYHDVECGKAVYSLNKDNNLVAIHSGIGPYGLLQLRGVLQRTKDQFRFIITENAAYNGMEYRILDTDYQNYALVYSCSTISSNNALKQIWILSRTPELDKQILKILLKSLKISFGYGSSDLHWTNQDDEICRM
jgi:lipocalin